MKLEDFLEKQRKKHETAQESTYKINTDTIRHLARQIDADDSLNYFGAYLLWDWARRTGAIIRDNSEANRVETEYQRTKDAQFSPRHFSTVLCDAYDLRKVAA